MWENEVYDKVSKSEIMRNRKCMKDSVRMRGLVTDKVYLSKTANVRT